MSKHHQHHQAQSQQKRDEHHQKEKKTELADIMGDDESDKIVEAKEREEQFRATDRKATAKLQRPYVGQSVHFWRAGVEHAAVVREVTAEGLLHLTVFTREGNVDAFWNTHQRTEKCVERTWDFIPNHNH